MEKYTKKNKLLAIILVVLCTILTATGQMFWKFGVNMSDGTLLSYFNLFVILGFVSYGLGALLLVAALKFWELSRVHPFLALGYIWAVIFAPIFLGELISMQQLIGIGIIIIGVICVGVETKKVN